MEPWHARLEAGVSMIEASLHEARAAREISAATLDVCRAAAALDRAGDHDASKRLLEALPNARP